MKLSTVLTNLDQVTDLEDGNYKVTPKFMTAVIGQAALAESLESRLARVPNTSTRLHAEADAAIAAVPHIYERLTYLRATVSDVFTCGMTPTSISKLRTLAEKSWLDSPSDELSAEALDAAIQLEASVAGARRTPANTHVSCAKSYAPILHKLPELAHSLRGNSGDGRGGRFMRQFARAVVRATKVQIASEIAGFTNRVSVSVPYLVVRLGHLLSTVDFSGTWEEAEASYLRVRGNLGPDDSDVPTDLRHAILTLLEGFRPNWGTFLEGVNLSRLDDMLTELRDGASDADTFEQLTERGTDHLASIADSIATAEQRLDELYANIRDTQRESDRAHTTMVVANSELESLQNAVQIARNTEQRLAEEIADRTRALGDLNRQIELAQQQLATLISAN